MKHYVYVQKGSAKWHQVNWFTNLNHAIQDAKHTHLNPDNLASKRVTAVKVETGKRQPIVQFHREKGMSVANQHSYAKLWTQFTPSMKKKFRRFFRRSFPTTKTMPGATIAALQRRGVIFTHNSSVHVNWRGCELMDYLRVSKQVTKDRS